jgi:putative acetyltransferase
MSTVGDSLATAPDGTNRTLTVRHLCGPAQWSVVRARCGTMAQAIEQSCKYLCVIVRRQEPSDYEAAQVVYTDAFKRPDHPERVPTEVGIFAALWEAKDVIDELSFTALAENAVVGHVTASRAKVGFHSVVAVGPIGVLPEHQGKGIGSALMSALLDAADTQNVPLVVLLGSPQYYGRFGFRSAVELDVVPPEPKWGSAFQARPLRAYAPSVAGPFQYAPAFSS